MTRLVIHPFNGFLVFVGCLIQCYKWYDLGRRGLLRVWRVDPRNSRCERDSLVNLSCYPSLSMKRNSDEQRSLDETNPAPSDASSDSKKSTYESTNSTRQSNAEMEREQTERRLSEFYVHQWRLALFRLVVGVYLFLICVLSSVLRYFPWFYIFYTIWHFHVLTLYFCLSSMLTFYDHFLVFYALRTGGHASSARISDCFRSYLCGRVEFVVYSLFERVFHAIFGKEASQNERNNKSGHSGANAAGSSGGPSSSSSPSSSAPSSSAIANDNDINDHRSRLNGIVWLIGNVSLGWVAIVDIGAWFLLYPTLNSRGQQKLRNFWNVNFHVCNLFIYLDYYLSTLSPTFNVRSRLLGSLECSEEMDQVDDFNGSAQESGDVDHPTCDVSSWKSEKLCCCDCGSKFIREWKASLDTPHSLVFLSMPLIYILFVWLYVLAGGRYPYWFVYSQYPTNGVLWLVVWLAHAATMYLFFKLDRLWKVPRKIIPLESQLQEFAALISFGRVAGLTVQKTLSEVEMEDENGGRIDGMRDEPKSDEDDDRQVTMIDEDNDNQSDVVGLTQQIDIGDPGSGAE